MKNYSSWFETEADQIMKKNVRTVSSKTMNEGDRN